MPKSIAEYADWLDGRDLIWPRPGPPRKAKAKPFVEHLPGVRAVTWSVYGTLLRIADGQLLLDHTQDLRMQIAMDKTIKEFNMWLSMSRHPGAPWEYMLPQYRDIVAESRMAAAAKGDRTEVNSATVWRKLLARLEQKEYDYDRGFYGDMDQLSEKVAFFFHRNLQGVAAMRGALRALRYVVETRRTQSLLADAQPFTLVQLVHALKHQGRLMPVRQMFVPPLLTLSFREKVRKPSKSLFQRCVSRFADAGIAPEEILHVGSRLADDLGPARACGMRTALFAGDADSLQATRDELRDPVLKPDRLMTDLRQIRNILDAAPAAAGTG